MLWRLAPMIYGPTVLFALGEGAVVPLFPVIAAQLGADVPTAALVASALVVGQLCGNIPAGWAVSRIGERMTMIIGGVLALGGVAGMLFAPSLPVLAAAVFLIGFCAAAFGLARHSFMTTRVPVAYRARALSLLGGTFRLGMFVGPFLAAALIAIFGDEHSTVWFFGACLLATIRPARIRPRSGGCRAGPARHAFVRRLEARRRHRRACHGVDPRARTRGRVPDDVAFPRRAVAARARGGIPVGGPLGAASGAAAVGCVDRLDAQTIALVVGISGAIDFALFYASGQVMDRFGRLWAALPAMVLMGSGFLALAFTHDLSQAAMWFALFAAVLGVGNGLSSGILLTLGADVAPQDDPAAFLGSWRTLTDAGGAIAPLLVSAIAAVVSLSVATGVIGVIGLAGAAGFIRWVPRFVPRTR